MQLSTMKCETCPGSCSYDLSLFDLTDFCSFWEGFIIRCSFYTYTNFSPTYFVIVFQNNVLEVMSVPISVIAMVDKISTCWFLTTDFTFLQQYLIDIFIMSSMHKKKKRKARVFTCVITKKTLLFHTFSSISVLLSTFLHFIGKKWALSSLTFLHFAVL